MKIGQDRQTIHAEDATFDLRRTAGGVMEMWGEDDDTLAAAAGFAHGLDRMLQLMLVRLIAQGRVCECLRSDADSLAIDRFAREMNFAAAAREDVANLTVDARRFADRYCAGLNACLERHGYPWEFRLVGYRPEPWRPTDILATYQVMAYVGLAQSQQDAEKFIIQSVKGGVDPNRLRALFAPHLDGLTPEIVDLIRRTNVCQPLLPDAIKFLGAVPKLMASNNWVVAGSRTASGKPMQCNDPHLECNRLPAVWYEVVQHTADDFRIGITMPGIPGVLMGRTGATTFGFTYGFMDMIDYYIEDVQGGRCRRGAGFEDLVRREERIARKKQAPVTLTVWETRHGVLETPPEATDLSDGYYLARAWSGHQSASAQGLNALHRLPRARTVADMQDIVAEVTISGNWLVADSQGNIGYQQSGRLPVRAHSGLHPVPGWDEKYDWAGYAPTDQLARRTNPPEGYLATANNDFNEPGKLLSMNLPMGSYRAERIEALLAEHDTCVIDDMKRLQRDVYSLQAERFMALFQPHLPDAAVGTVLRNWDRRYARNSRGATLFEAVYHELLAEVFGRGMFGEAAWRETVAETNILTDFYHVFDDALLGDDPSWYGDAGRDTMLRGVVCRVCERYPTPDAVPAWGSQRQVMMTNLFFAGALPRFLGFDRGPVVLEGNRATIVQGAIYRAHGRVTTFCPSYRFIADLGDGTAHTALAGGPSDRRFSPYYATDIERWQQYEYKVLRGA